MDMAQLSDNRQLEIIDEVELLRDKFKNMPLKKIIEKEESLEGFYFNPKTPKQRTISGFIRVDDDDKFKIFINSSISDTRKRFTLAHELGHYFLHKESIVKEKFRVDTQNYTSSSSIVETEANFFAAELLMPFEFFISKLNELDFNISKTAEFFNVSYTAAKVRKDWIIKNLNMYKERYGK